MTDSLQMRVSVESALLLFERLVPLFDTSDSFAAEHDYDTG